MSEEVKKWKGIKKRDRAEGESLICLLIAKGERGKERGVPVTLNLPLVLSLEGKTYAQNSFEPCLI